MSAQPYAVQDKALPKPAQLPARCSPCDYPQTGQSRGRQLAAQTGTGQPASWRHAPDRRAGQTRWQVLPASMPSRGLRARQGAGGTDRAGALLRHSSWYPAALMQQQAAAPAKPAARITDADAHRHASTSPIAHRSRAQMQAYRPRHLPPGRTRRRPGPALAPATLAALPAASPPSQYRCPCLPAGRRRPLSGQKWRLTEGPFCGAAPRNLPGQRRAGSTGPARAARWRPVAGGERHARVGMHVQKQLMQPGHELRNAPCMPASAQLPS